MDYLAVILIKITKFFCCASAKTNYLPSFQEAVLPLAWWCAPILIHYCPANVYFTKASFGYRKRLLLSSIVQQFRGRLAGQWNKSGMSQHKRTILTPLHNRTSVRTSSPTKVGQSNDKSMEFIAFFKAQNPKWDQITGCFYKSYFHAFLQELFSCLTGHHCVKQKRTEFRHFILAAHYENFNG